MSSWTPKGPIPFFSSAFVALFDPLGRTKNWEEGSVGGPGCGCFPLLPLVRDFLALLRVIIWVNSNLARLHGRGVSGVR